MISRAKTSHLKEPCCQPRLEKGVDLNAANGDGWMPLHPASQNGFIEIIQLLLEKGVPI